MIERSNRPEVRNPILALEAFHRLACLLEPHPGVKAALAAGLYELSNICRANADVSWRKNKGPMAVYWKGFGAYFRHTARALKAAAVVSSRLARQREVGDWCAAAFGMEHATSLAQRAIRFREEAEELYQAAMHQAGFSGADMLELAHRQTDHVHGRPVGIVGQELGGVGVTTLALANAAGLDADAEEAREVKRVLAKPLSHFAARNAEKNAAGFDLTSRAYPTRPA